MESKTGKNTDFKLNLEKAKEAAEKIDEIINEMLSAGCPKSHLALKERSESVDTTNIFLFGTLEIETKDYDYFDSSILNEIIRTYSKSDVLKNSRSIFLGSIYCAQISKTWQEHRRCL